MTVHPPKVPAKLVRAVLDICGEGSHLVAAHEREWASATFCGARHCLDLLIPAAGNGATLPCAIAELPDYEFDLAGEIVADCSVTMGACSRQSDGRLMLALRIELLTITAD